MLGLCGRGYYAVPTDNRLFDLCTAYRNRSVHGSGKAGASGPEARIKTRILKEIKASSLKDKLVNAVRVNKCCLISELYENQVHFSRGNADTQCYNR